MDRNLKTSVSTMAVQIATVDTEEDHALSAEFRFDASDPWAVTMVLSTVSGPVDWTFARDLLIEGQYEPTGDGDVHVWPCLDSTGRAVVIIELCSPDGEALVQVRTSDLHAFVDRMDAAVTPGTESLLIDVDSAITSILAAETA